MEHSNNIPKSPLQLFGQADYNLLPIEDVNEDGAPTLVANSKEIICAVKLKPDDKGKFALCLVPASHPEMIIILSVLNIGDLIQTIQRAISEDNSQLEEPIIFKTGKSELQLHPTGKIKLLGDDVTVRSRGRMGIRGAYIDLN